MTRGAVTRIVLTTRYDLAEFIRCGNTFEHDGNLYRIYGTSSEPRPRWGGAVSREEVTVAVR